MPEPKRVETGITQLCFLGKSAKSPALYSAKAQLCFYLLPRDAGFSGIALNCVAKLNQVFNVFDAFLEPTHLGSQRFQGRLLNGGNVTHMLSCDPLQHTR